MSDIKIDETKESPNNGDDLFNDALHDDVTLIVFGYLPIADQFNMRRVCKRWYQHLNYLLDHRNRFAVTLNADEPNDGCFKLDCSNDKHAINGNDCIALKCRTIKDGSRILYIVSNETLNLIFNRCVNVTTLSMMHTIFDRNVWEFFRDRCPNLLEHIDFSYSQGLIDEVLSFIALKCGPTLKHITLIDSDISESTLESIIKYSPNLESLNINKNVRVSGECFSLLTSNLKHLSINDCWSIPMTGISNLVNGNGKYLNKLEIGESLNGKMLQLICENCRCLTCFEVDCSNIHNQRYLKCMGKLTELRELTAFLPFFNCDAFLLSVFKGCVNLRYLMLEGCIITDASLKYIGDYCLCIETLSISTGEAMRNEKITDECLNSISKLLKLTHLDIQSTNIGNGLIKVIKECKLLHSLEIDGCRKVNDEFMNACIEVMKDRSSQTLTVFARDTRIKNTSFELPQNLQLILE